MAAKVDEDRHRKGLSTGVSFLSHGKLGGGLASHRVASQRSEASRVERGQAYGGGLKDRSPYLKIEITYKMSLSLKGAVLLLD